LLESKLHKAGWIMCPHNRSRIIAVFSVFLLLASIAPTPAQTVDHKGIGSVQIQGSVLLNGTAGVTGATVFAGDSVRTGADGSALVNLPGRGSMVVAPNSDITFPNIAIGSHFVALHKGKIAFRILPEASETTAEFGKLVLRPVIGQGVEFDIEIAGDGSAIIRCTSGSVGIIEIQGANSTFLNAGQSAKISENGVAEIIPPSSGTSEASSQTPGNTHPTATPGGKSHATTIILVLAAVGVSAAVAVLVVERSKSPVSPSAP
jgi:hypothetical protein